MKSGWKSLALISHALEKILILRVFLLFRRGAWHINLSFFAWFFIEFSLSSKNTEDRETKRKAGSWSWDSPHPRTFPLLHLLSDMTKGEFGCILLWNMEFLNKLRVWETSLLPVVENLIEKCIQINVEDFWNWSLSSFKHIGSYGLPLCWVVNHLALPDFNSNTGKLPTMKT